MSDRYPPAGGVHERDAAELSEPRHDRPAMWTLHDYLRVVRERWLIVAAVFVLSVSGAAVYCYTATPMYEARAQLVIDPEAPQIVAFKEIIEEQSGKTDYYLTQLQILQSRSLARTTLDNLNLWRDPEFTATADRLAPLRRRLGFPAPPTAGRDAAQPGDTVVHLQAIGRFLQRLTIEPIRNSRLVNVRFRSANPRVGAAVVNTLVRAYIDRITDIKRAESKDALTWLEGQIAQQRKAVQEQELQLHRIRDRNDVVLKGQQNVVIERLSELNDAATRAQAERIEKEAAYEQLAGRDGDAAGSGVDPSPAIDELRTELRKAQAEETRLEEELGDRHPDLIAARAAVREAQASLDSEMTIQRARAQRDVRAARGKEKRLSAAFEAQKAEALSLDRNAIEYDALQHDATSNRQVLDSLLQREKEMAVAGELKTSNVRIVDSASEPLSSVYPRKQVVLGVASFTGLGVGFALALVIGYTDTRIKSPDEIRRLLEIPFLGFAPALSAKAASRTELLLDEGAPGAFGEALRAVRTNLALERWAGRPRVLVVTSAGRGEGKSLLALHLAVALTQARQRVLLIDGDMRRPRLHDAFGQPRVPGLSDCLIDPAVAPAAVRETGFEGLAFLPAGIETSNAADLLGFDPVSHIQEMVPREFDWTIIDSPPVGDVTDACLFAGGDVRVVFVVAADRVRRTEARAAVERLIAADASFAGAVLSRVSSWTHQYYG